MSGSPASPGPAPHAAATTTAKGSRYVRCGATRDVQGVFNGPLENTFLIKLNYWFGF